MFNASLHAIEASWKLQTMHAVFRLTTEIDTSEYLYICMVPVSSPFNEFSKIILLLDFYKSNNIILYLCY